MAPVAPIFFLCTLAAPTWPCADKEGFDDAGFLKHVTRKPRQLYQRYIKNEFTTFPCFVNGDLSGCTESGRFSFIMLDVELASVCFKLSLEERLLDDLFNLSECRHNEVHIFFLSNQKEKKGKMGGRNNKQQY